MAAFGTNDPKKSFLNVKLSNFMLFQAIVSVMIDVHIGKGFQMRPFKEQEHNDGSMH